MSSNSLQFTNIHYDIFTANHKRKKKKRTKKMFMNTIYKKYGDTCEDTKAQRGAPRETSQKPIRSRYTGARVIKYRNELS